MNPRAETVLNDTRDVELKFAFITSRDGDAPPTIDFGPQRFDLAILGHIVHLIGERSTRNLLSKLHRALKHGGRVAILDIVPNKERTGPTFPVLFALLMLLRTKDGGTYTVTECSDWLKTAGFHCIEIVETFLTILR